MTTGLSASPCSDESRQRFDSMIGTAAPVERWLLVEIAGPWGRNAFTQSHLDPRIGEAIVRRAVDHDVRPIAVRRPGRHATQTAWRWAFADSRLGHEGMIWGRADHPADILDVPFETAPESARSGEPAAPAEPAYLVCTHARHDRCCAVRGRPVADALATSRPEQTWECSHLGGDRFAATMVVLPHGIYFGRVDADNVADIADAYERGQVVNQLVRGRSSVSPAVQAAQHEARALSGDHAITSYPPIRVDARGPHRWHVLLGVGDGEIAFDVVEEPSAELHATCLSQRLARVPTYRAALAAT